MATGQWPSLVDLSTRLDPEGKIPIIAEMLSQANDYTDDLPWVEANEHTGHEFVFRTSIPAGSWRQINMGVPYSKSTTAKSRVGLGTLDAALPEYGLKGPVRRRDVALSRTQAGPEEILAIGVRTLR